MNKVRYVIQPPGKFSLNLGELWQYRELFYFFVWRDVKVKYKQTVLGFLWAILQPLIMMTIFTLFFSKGLKLPTSEIPAPVFYFSGLLFWNLFSSGMTTSANSIVSNSNIIKKIYFPRLIIPFSGVFVALFDFLMGLVIYACMVIYYQFTMPDFQVDPAIFLYLPLALFITLTCTIGLGSILSAWTVKYRDFRYVIPFMIQSLLFITPVIYPLTIMDKTPVLKYILALNPMTGAVILARKAFTETLPADQSVIIISTIMALVVFVLGIYTFRKTEYYFADIA